jgi:CHAT domain-containing protein/Tfp pilus assembly protein PilF
MRSLVQRLKPLLLAAILAMALPVAGAHAQTGPANRKPEEEVSRLIAQGNYPAAERMALAELKRDASEEGPRSLRAALWHNRLGQVAQLDGRYERALERFRLSRDIRRDRLGASHGDTLIAQGNMSLVLARLGRWREADPMMREVLAGNRRLLGDGHPRTVTNMTNLGLLSMDLGRQQDARALLEEALTLTRKARQPQSDNLATALANLAALYITDMEFARAEPLLDEALALDERRHGPDHPALASTLNNLGQLHHATGRHADAARAYQRALAIDSRHLPPGHALTAGTLANLAALYRDMGELQKARSYLARALDATARNPAGADDANAMTLSLIAENLAADGRHAEAQALLWKTISGIEARLSQGHPATAPLLMQLASTQFATRSNPKSLAFKAHEIISRTHGIDSAQAARSALAVTRILIKSGNLEDALTWASQARTQIAIHFGTASYDHAVVQHLYATACFGVGRNDDAQVALAGALPGLEAALPAQAETAADAMLLMVKILRARNDFSGALAYARKAARIADTLARHDLLHAKMARAQPEDSTSRKINTVVLQAALDVAAAEDGSTAEDALATAFTMADRLLSGSLHQAMALGALRAGLLKTEPAALLDLLETSVSSLRLSQARYAHALASGAPASLVTARRSELLDNVRRADDADSRLRGNALYKRYLALEPASLATARKALRKGELLVMIVPLENAHVVLAASTTDLASHIVPMTPADMATEVDALRTQLDPAGWKSTLPPFSRARAHRLHQALFGPLKAMMRSSTRLTLVVGGPLKSLPFATLVTRPVLASDRADSAPANLRDTAWLIRSHTIATYPSLSSFVALRAKQPAPTTRPWAIVGIGAPPADKQLKLKPLAHSNAELASLRKLGPTTLLLGTDATEERLAALDLSQTRVLAFATHMLASGPGATEPGLALARSQETDGRLTPPEIMQLRLGGAFVVLSACNTAGSGARNTDALAEAFFRAGAGTVMHTHWPVFDAQAATLSASALAAYRQAPEEGQAAALRKAMIGMIGDRTHPLNAHPSAWAAFSVVGEVLSP